MHEFADRYFKPLYITIAALSLLSLVAIAAAGYLYWKSRPEPSPSALPAAVDNTQLLEKISSIIQLPIEAPTIATITDKTKLAGQAFFTLAENGDIVLIYSRAQKAYLYRPGTHKILDVAPINFPSASPP
ncbi:hypothetical protein HYW29_00155 [Candidatus Amesbacteria bacterium]|nr:hypothetical protein [Candidatus Amesbacteria bacterium]